MAGAKSGKAPGNAGWSPGGGEIYSTEDHDYFTDRGLIHEGSLDQVKQQWKDQERLDKIKKGSYTVPKMCKGGKVVSTRTWR